MVAAPRCAAACCIGGGMGTDARVLSPRQDRYDTEPLQQAIPTRRHVQQSVQLYMGYSCTFVMTQSLCWMSDRLHGIDESDFSRDFSTFVSDLQPNSSYSSSTLSSRR